MHIHQFISQFKLRIYRFSIPLRARRLRRKKKITVLFVIKELGSWKTENLYNMMLNHPRFYPKLFVDTEQTDREITTILLSYLNGKGYSYRIWDENVNLYNLFTPDIIFYQKPYGDTFHHNVYFARYPKVLFCYNCYAFNTISELWSCNQKLHNYCWQIYYENKLAAINVPKVSDIKGSNLVITGLSFEDEYINPILGNDPWKLQDSRKKRIIYAPHHTIPEDPTWIQFSTFLLYAHFMLEMAEKYKEQVQFAFKPHPLLKYKLNKIWGETKTQSYYNRWRDLENGQLEMGKYRDLFFYSDAMIHDCSSFTIEYMYTQNPVLYLSNTVQEHAQDLNDFSRQAFYLHYFAQTKDDIERFILNVINGIDYMKLQRQSFYKEQLIPPYGKTACENIIDAILGNKEYSKTNKL